jgi:hypothetical protein
LAVYMFEIYIFKNSSIITIKKLWLKQNCMLKITPEFLAWLMTETFQLTHSNWTNMWSKRLPLCTTFCSQWIGLI